MSGHDVEHNSGNLNASILQTPRWKARPRLNIVPFMPQALRPKRNVELGRRLDLARRAIGMSQKEFAQEAGIAITTYNQYEKGASFPPVAAAQKICRKHHLTLDYIYSGDRGALKKLLADTIEHLEAVDAARKPPLKVVSSRPARAER
jgi:transcriptional regulator with XRE-family HTH domain